MVRLLATVLQCLFLQISCFKQSPGEQLANVVATVYANSSDTADICILNDSRDSPWIDLLDDFIPLVSSSRAINRIEFLAAASRKCDFHLIFLKPPTNFDENNRLMKRLFTVTSRNRHGIYVFVMLDEENTSNLYSRVTKKLGLVHSVLIIMSLNENISQIWHYDYFKMQKNSLISFESILQIISQKVEDTFGHRFIALLYNTHPLLFIRNNTIFGSQGKLLQTFVSHINATFYVRTPNGLNTSKIAQCFADGSIHVINALKPIQTYAEVVVTDKQPGLCLLVPERLIGTLFNHLLRPFTVSTVTGVIFYILVSQIVYFRFPTHLPRSILEQIFFGPTLPDYRMNRLERFTIYVGTALLFVLSEAYTAKLFQFVFNQKYEPHLESLHDLSKTENLIYGIEEHI